MADEALKARELQPLREHLEELGEKALPALQEWAERHWHSLSPLIVVTWKLPAEVKCGPAPLFAAGGGGGAAGGVVRVIGTDRTNPAPTEGAGIEVWGTGVTVSTGMAR